jgi:hypothetical protein
VSITAHREAVESLLTAANARVGSPTYPMTTVFIDAGPGATETRRQSSDYAARDFLVHTNVDALSREQREALLDRVMSIENARPVVPGRVCDPLTVQASMSPDPNRDLADREVWTASVIWRLRSYAA